MSSVYLYPNTNYKGNPRIYFIYESKNVNDIILYKNNSDPLPVRSLVNNTNNYYILFYYQKVVMHLVETTLLLRKIYLHI